MGKYFKGLRTLPAEEGIAFVKARVTVANKMCTIEAPPPRPLPQPVVVWSPKEWEDLMTYLKHR